MIYDELYKSKLTTAKEAASKVKSGERVYIGQTSSIAYALAEALMDREDELEDVTICSSNIARPLKCHEPGHSKAFKLCTFFMGNAERKIQDPDIMEFTPVLITQDAIWVEHGARPDWAFLEVSQPDEEGFMSFGAGGVTHHEHFKNIAKHVVLQVNKNAPYVYGAHNLVHVSEAEYIVEADTPLCTVQTPGFDDTLKTISDYILEQIPDGACLQLGIGGVAGALGLGLKQKNDLGIHTEMLTDSMMDLITSGNVTNAKKGFMPGISTVVFAFGSEELYRFCNYNDKLWFAPYRIINDPYTIAKNDNMISINTAFSVDLLSQVSAESIGYRQYSGTGGQIDYVHGSQMAKGGKSFIAIPSTYTDNDGKLQSRIVLNFPAGTAVTTPRTEVQYVVTEYGCRNLKILNRKDKALALIELSHPSFREELKEQAKRCGLI